MVTIGDGLGPNLLSLSNLAALHSLIDRVHRNPEVRILVIKGAGARFFVAGADLRELRELDAEGSLLFSRLGQSLFDKMEKLDQVVIAAVNGYCMGGGVDLLLACDLRYATPESVFAHTGSRMGIITGFGGTVRLPAEIGFARARELFFTAGVFSAEEALGFGLINGVVDSGHLIEHCLSRAEKISVLPRETVAEWKRGAVAAKNFGQGSL